MCIGLLGGFMGKDLVGKELGEFLSQRKDGVYYAKYTDRFMVRMEEKKIW